MNQLIKYDFETIFIYVKIINNGVSKIITFLDIDQVDHDGNDAILCSKSKMISIINIDIPKIGFSFVSTEDGKRTELLYTLI